MPDHLNQFAIRSPQLKQPTTDDLIERVRACRLCPRMEGRTRVFGHSNGCFTARLLFVAEAPGRLGADKSGIPLSSDQSGRNFTILLEAAGIQRDEIFVTNAVLCNPRDARGNNAPPTTREVSNCSPNLADTINLINPDYVITLGVVALKALARISPHEIVLSQDVGRPLSWHGRILVPLYHPGSRASIYRPIAAQMKDYKRLGKLVQS